MFVSPQPCLLIGSPWAFRSSYTDSTAQGFSQIYHQDDKTLHLRKYQTNNMATCCCNAESRGIFCMKVQLCVLQYLIFLTQQLMPCPHINLLRNTYPPEDPKLEWYNNNLYLSLEIPRQKIPKLLFSEKVSTVKVSACSWCSFVIFNVMADSVRPFQLNIMRLVSKISCGYVRQV